MEIIETVRSTDTTRVRIVVDPDPINPRERFAGMGAHALTIDDFGGRYVKVDPDGGPLEEGWSRISWRWDAVDVFERWARIFHGAVTHYSHRMDGPTVIWYSLPDYWGREGFDRETILAYVQRTDACYRAWAAGEVYGLVKEQKNTWFNKEINEHREMWTAVNWAWGYYDLDDARADAISGDLWW